MDIDNFNLKKFPVNTDLKKIYHQPLEHIDSTTFHVVGSDLICIRPGASRANKRVLSKLWEIISQNV